MLNVTQAEIEEIGVPSFAGDHSLPVALMLTLGALLWFRIDATEELIPEPRPDTVPDMAVPVLS